MVLIMNAVRVSSSRDVAVCFAPVEPAVSSSLKPETEKKSVNFACTETFMSSVRHNK